MAAPLTAFAASESAPAENGILGLLPAPLRDLIDPENAPLRIAEQGIFSAGGTVIRSDGTFDVGNYYTSREGSTAHVDHEGITGNDHFMFQDLNNDVIAGHIENWIQQNVQ